MVAASALARLLALPVRAATFTLNPSADAFVTTGPSGNSRSGSNSSAAIRAPRFGPGVRVRGAPWAEPRKRAAAVPDTLPCLDVPARPRDGTGDLKVRSCWHRKLMSSRNVETKPKNEKPEPPRLVGCEIARQAGETP